ncbi:MAG: ABC transporter permease [Planctomycetes bacterium]|nr:ABC transporter permease [Planctomycetota bacterium]MCB9904906.1 ABC transporter permease [Planctomycetota bacterium]
MPGRPAGLGLLREMAALPRTLAEHIDLLRGGLARELSARFRGSALGFGWVLLTPLVLFAIYAFLFTRVLGMRMGPDAPAAAMGVYMYIGTLSWSGVSEGIARGTSSVLEGRNLVSKLRFPAELLPIQAALASLIPTVCGLAMFVLAALFTDLWAAPSARLLFAPLVLLVQLLLTAGPALAFAAWHVRVRDTAQVVGVGLTVAMFATPVFWVASPELLPGIEPLLRWIEANPYHHLLQCWRAVLMGDEPAVVFERTDLFASLGYAAACGVASCAFGLAVFLRGRRELSDEV